MRVKYHYKKLDAVDARIRTDEILRIITASLVKDARVSGGNPNVTVKERSEKLRGVAVCA